VSIAASAALGVVLIGKWGELKTGVTGAPIAIAAAAVGLQVLALVSRSEAWHRCVRAGGGTVGRRTLFRASSMGFVGGLLHTQLGTAARIAALRRSAPEESPRIAPLLTAEVPIMVVEGLLAALASVTLIAPLGLPWWAPLVVLAGALALPALRRLGPPPPSPAALDADEHRLRDALRTGATLDQLALRPGDEIVVGAKPQLSWETTLRALVIVAGAYWSFRR
jgi:hypothetical protein